MAVSHASRPPAIVSVLPLHAEWRVHMEMSSAAPLYLSTPFNFGYISPENPAYAMTEVDGGVFSEPFVPKLSVRSGLPAGLRDAVPATSAPPLHRLLPLQFWDAAATFGTRSPSGAGFLAPRRAWMRIEDFATCETARLDGVPLERGVLLEFPRGADVSVWHPAAFSLLVDALGPVGPALPLPYFEDRVGTGNLDVDAAIRRFFATPPMPFTNLPSGHYRVIIGP
jgi:hypothetical protein